MEFIPRTGIPFTALLSEVSPLAKRDYAGDPRMWNLGKNSVFYVHHRFVK